MGSRRRLAIAWRRTEPARRGRFLAWLLPIGIVHGVLSGSASLLVPDELARSGGLLVALVMVPAAWITGWILRGRIAAARGGETVAWTAWSLLMGAWISGSLFAFLGGTVALVEGDLGTAAGMIGFSWGLSLVYCALGAVVAFPTVLASIPLTWLAILLLRWAAGGTSEPPPRPRRAHTALAARGSS